MLLWILKKVFPYSPLSIVVECGLISFWLEFLTAVIIPECLLPSHSPSSLSLSPSLLRWAKWLRCGNREWFLSAAVQMQGQLKEAYAHLRLAKKKHFYSGTERLWCEHWLISALSTSVVIQHQKHLFCMKKNTLFFPPTCGYHAALVELSLSLWYIMSDHENMQ